MCFMHVKGYIFFYKPLKHTVHYPTHVTLNAYQTDFNPVSYNASFGKKFWRANCWVYGYNTLAVSLLVTLPERTTLWHLSDVRAIKPQYKRTFTQPPVLDSDHWYINYMGHPYQGSCYYNAMANDFLHGWSRNVRKQKANMLNRRLFCQLKYQHYRESLAGFYPRYKGALAACLLYSRSNHRSVTEFCVQCKIPHSKI